MIENTAPVFTITISEDVEETDDGRTVVVGYVARVLDSRGVEIDNITGPTVNSVARMAVLAIPA